jgi:hypothetical protein
MKITDEDQIELTRLYATLRSYKDSAKGAGRNTYTMYNAEIAAVMRKIVDIEEKYRAKHPRRVIKKTQTLDEALAKIRKHLGR